MDISSDLTFEVTTPKRGTSTGRVTAQGSRVTVDADDPVAVWDAAVGASTTGSAALRQVAGLLHDQGVTVEVTGPSGTVATVGAGVRSGVGRATTGSPHVRLGRLGAVAPLARAQVSASASTAVAAHRVEALVAAGLGVLALLAAARRASSRA